MERSPHDIITEFVQRFSQAAALPCDVTVSDDNGAEGDIRVDIRSEGEAKFLIGKNGQNLSALEHLIRAMCFRKNGTERRISVDINDYRRSRSEQVVQMVRQVVARVRDTRRSQALLPMAPHERRIVHMELASYTDVASESVGEDPNRRVVIKPLSL
ncbi:MAG TPA: R3H domain-containing nucleic acid-binding protein [Candidatus Paceibacterota bacterium]|nr:R3H domain-containing nucleic acid-binding protein [Candidatus Paceibacterota bacterium]